MSNDEEVGKIICNIAQDVYGHFSRQKYVPNIHFFGSLAKSVYVGEVPNSDIYDLDIEANVRDEIQLNEVFDFFKDLQYKYTTEGVIVEAKAVGGVVKPERHASKRKLFLHLMPGCVGKPAITPEYVKQSKYKHGVSIVGELPFSERVERIGLQDVLIEPERRIRQIQGQIELNRVFKEGKNIAVSNKVSPTSLENLSYSVRNNAANIVTALQPYVAKPHFDNSPQVFEDFRDIFPGHPWKNLPLQINDLTQRARKGHNVDVSGLDGEVLNFLAYNDQMLRNMIGTN